MKIRLEKLIGFWVLKLPPIMSVLILTLTIIGSFYFIRSLKFEYNIEFFFSADDKEVVLYNNHRSQFENENDYLLIGLKNNKGAFEIPFLKKVEKYTKELSNIKGVKKVTSPTNSSSFIKVPFIGLSKVNTLHINDAKQLQIDKEKLYQLKNYERTFFSSDTSALNIIVHIEDSLNSKESGLLFNKFQNKIKKYSFNEIHFAGRLRTQQYYISKMKKEMSLFSILAFSLVVLMLFFVFKKSIDVIMAISALLISMIISFGIIAYFGYHIDLMMILLPAVILITGTSGSIHFLKSYRSKKTVNVEERLKETINDTGIPLLFNALTTAVGFTSLYLIPVVPIQRFGIFAAMSILITFVVCLILISSIIRIFKLKKYVSDQRAKVKSDISWVFGKSKLLIIGITTMVVLMTITSFNLRINNFFLDDLNENSSLKDDLDFFESNFSGIRPFELSISSKKGNELLSFDNLKKIDRLSDYIEQNYGVGFVLGPHQVIKSINKSFHSGDIEYYKLPESDAELSKIKKFIKKKRLWNKLIPLTTEDFKQIRITGRVNDIGSEFYQHKNKSLKKFVDENLTSLDVKVTGAAHLMDKTSSNLSKNIVAGILLAIIVSTICIWLLTGRLLIAVISIVPNIIPLIFAGSVMWLFGIPLKIGTAIVFTIIYGLAVDDTLHFVHHYNKLRKENQSNKDAIQNTFDYLKAPLFSTTLVLSIGFLVFSLSEFQSISMMGVLIASSMIVALLVDLFLLPVILFRWIK